MTEETEEDEQLRTVVNSEIARICSSSRALIACFIPLCISDQKELCFKAIQISYRYSERLSERSLSHKDPKTDFSFSGIVYCVSIVAVNSLRCLPRDVCGYTQMNKDSFSITTTTTKRKYALLLYYFILKNNR